MIRSISTLLISLSLIPIFSNAEASYFRCPNKISNIKRNIEGKILRVKFPYYSEIPKNLENKISLIPNVIEIGSVVIGSDIDLIITYKGSQEILKKAISDLLIDVEFHDFMFM